MLIWVPILFGLNSQIWWVFTNQHLSVSTFTIESRRQLSKQLDLMYPYDFPLSRMFLTLWGQCPLFTAHAVKFYEFIIHWSIDKVSYLRDWWNKEHNRSTWAKLIYLKHTRAWKGPEPGGYPLSFGNRMRMAIDTAVLRSLLSTHNGLSCSEHNNNIPTATMETANLLK